MTKTIQALALTIGLSMIATPAFAFIDVLAHVLFAGLVITGSGKSHAQLCAEKFKNYNPATNIFTDKNGKKYKCVSQ